MQSFQKPYCQHSDPQSGVSKIWIFSVRHKSFMPHIWHFSTWNQLERYELPKSLTLKMYGTYTQEIHRAVRDWDSTLEGLACRDYWVQFLCFHSTLLVLAVGCTIFAQFLLVLVGTPCPHPTLVPPTPEPGRWVVHICITPIALPEQVGTYNPYKGQPLRAWFSGQGG